MKTLVTLRPTGRVTKHCSQVASHGCGANTGQSMLSQPSHGVLLWVGLLTSTPRSSVCWKACAATSECCVTDKACCVVAIAAVPFFAPGLPLLLLVALEHMCHGMSGARCNFKGGHHLPGLCLWRHPNRCPCRRLHVLDGSSCPLYGCQPVPVPLSMTLAAAITLHDDPCTGLHRVTRHK